jgi:hypothetical protein
VQHQVQGIRFDFPTAMKLDLLQISPSKHARDKLCFALICFAYGGGERRRRGAAAYGASAWR